MIQAALFVLCEEKEIAPWLANGLSLSCRQLEFIYELMSNFFIAP